MAGGAVIAAAAAAHARRIQAVLDAFRLAGATAPERARTLEQLGVDRVSEVDQLLEQGILVNLTDGAAWYLNEAAYITRRDARPSSAMRILVVVVAVLVVLAAALLVRAQRG